MKILVAGTGSIGRRHIANLLQLGASVRAYSYRLGGAQGPGIGLTAEFGFLEAPGIPPGAVPLAKDLDAALHEGLDAVVVANRTDQHMALALQAAAAGRHLFIEKPLGVGLAGIGALARLAHDKRLVVEAGFMLRFHPNLQWMHRALREGLIGQVFCARAAIGQWLPDWRPGIDHRQGYGALRAMGGGVTFDLIHEIDLMQWLLGPVVDVTALMRHVASLEIETEAVSQIGLRLASGALAQIHLDYVRPAYGREMEIVGRNGVLNWHYTTGVVRLTRADGVPEVVHRVPEDFERNHMFLAEMTHFLQRMSNPSLPAAASLDEGVAALRIAVASHLSAQQRRCVRPQELDESATVS